MDASSTPAQVEMSVAVLTSIFQIRGKLHILGDLATFLNDEQRTTMSVYDTNVLGVSASNPAAQMTQSEMIMNKRSAHLIAIEGTPPSVTLLPRIESLVMYTSQFAFMGKFHLGTDARVTDFAETSLSQYIPVTEVRIFPLFQARPGVINAASLAFIHKTAILTYHKS
jgi:hypothetical protein